MKVLAILFLVVAVSAKHEKYLGWKSYYLGPSTPGQMKAIGQLISEYDVDVLGHPVIGYEGVALVKPEVHDAFLEALQMEGIAYRVHRDDVKAALDQDDVLIERRRREIVARGGREMPYDNYQPLSVIYDYIDSVAARNPDTVTLVTPANSFEGRPIKYLKISTTNFQDEYQLPHYQPYTVGNAALVLWYGASGAAEDYAHLVGVPLSYTYELPGFSGTWDGFHLAPSAIEQVAKDTWEGVAVGARRAGDLFVTLKK